jgi:hypothetical protein
LANSQTAVSSRAIGLTGLLMALGSLGRADEAVLIADEAANAARELGWPALIAGCAGCWYGRAVAAIDPPRALAALRSGLDYSRHHRVVFVEILTAYDLAVVEAEHGDLQRGLDLFDFSIDSWQRSGDRYDLARGLARLAMCFARLHEQEPAAVIYGGSTRRLGAAPPASHKPSSNSERTSVAPRSIVALRPGQPWKPATPSPTPPTDQPFP